MTTTPERQIRQLRGQVLNLKRKLAQWEARLSQVEQRVKFLVEELCQRVDVRDVPAEIQKRWPIRREKK